MSRLPITLQSQLSPETEIKYQRVAKAGSGLAATFQALFANPPVASGLADLHELVSRIGQPGCQGVRGILQPLGAFWR